MDYSIIMLVVMLLIFYFLLIRPENKRKKQAEQMRNSIKKGDKIITIGGVVGRVVQVNADSIIIETSEDRVRVEFKKWAIQSVGDVDAVPVRSTKKEEKAETAAADDEGASFAEAEAAAEKKEDAAE
ncbi:MAG: preprotein translocase subunit YajC [Oscillospiraceae bacterium]|nr:preprotein translocase subunit YajC [Oscillospiraceae bacterium]